MSTSATSVHDKFQPVMDAYTRDTRAARKAVQAERDAQVALLYRDARTYRLKHADPVRETEKGRRVLSLVPEAITLVTPDLRDPARDHLFFGPTPVLSRNLHWNRANREVSFATSDGRHEIHGHLTMTHNRLRAYGTFSIDGQDVAVEYHVDPQRYRMRVAKDAAYQADSGEIRWDTSSPAWKDAAWSTEYELGFTYGVDGEEVIGDERLYTFLAKFDNVHTGRRWEPIRGSYGGFLDRKRFLAFGMSGGSMPPTGPGTELFPNRMRCLLSEFGADFDGGMVVGAGDARTVYGVKGDWAGHGIAGLYHLGAGTGNAARMVTVHDRRLYAGATAAEHSVIDGDVLSWSGLDKFAADQAGIPTTGHLRFSPDGRDVVESSFGAVGSRVHPDEILALADRIPLTGLVQAVRRGAALAEPRSAGEH
ncbi:MAG: hypothetical protein HOV83_40185, partial [Catenulispora sp.]|nr:hypothetical protein [Catenulispora sp.]